MNAASSFTAIPPDRAAQWQRAFELLFAAYAIYLAALVFRAAWLYGFELGRLIVITFMMSMAIGLALRKLFARRTLAVLVLLAALFLPFAYINPLVAGDRIAAGLEPPTIPELMAWLIPLEIFLFIAAYVLDLRLESVDEPTDAP